MKWLLRRGLAVFGLMWAPCFGGYQAAAEPAPSVALPPARNFDPGKGLIDGKVAVGLWPGTSSALDRKAADPAGFEASALHFGKAEFKDKVPEGDFSREITLSLKPLEGTPVALVLPSGQPALGAEVWIRADSPASAAILSTDETGRVSLPDSAVGIPLLVRAPGAASGFVLWDGEAESIALGPPGPPLTIAARKDTGDPAAWARLALWIDGTRFSADTLRWAFNALPVDRNGLTTLRGLPPRPLELLLWSPDPRISGLAETGAFDAQRTTLAFPWPSVATVTTAE